MNLKELLGQKIKRLRKNRNLTQEQFAEMIDIAPRTLSRIEVGESFVTAETLERIISALEIEPNELFAYEDSKSSEELLEEAYFYLDCIKNDRSKLEKCHRLLKLIRENEL